MHPASTHQPDPPGAAAQLPVITTGLTWLFAIAAGAAVGNLYWAQPLLDFIARELHGSAATAGWLVTAAQVGYAIGIMLIVPLGDVLNRRLLIPLMMVCAAAALVACALAPSFGILLIAIGAVGLTTVAGQILTPLAGDLADEGHRGQVVGTVVAGILTGILVSRTISGLVAGAAGWRTIFAAAAGADIVLAILLYRAIPQLAPKTQLRYPALIASVVAVVRRERVVRWTLVLGATGFGVFTMFWTALTFLLSAPPFSYPVSVIGLFGLAGLAGAITAQRAGRFHDRGWSLPATGAAWALAVVAFVIAGLASRSLAGILITVVLLDIAIQSLNILNQARVLSVSSEARSRLNTALVTGNFIGGAIGSAITAWLWSADGWRAVTVAGSVLCCFGLAVWAFGRRSALVVDAAHPSSL